MHKTVSEQMPTTFLKVSFFIPFSTGDMVFFNSVSKSYNKADQLNRVLVDYFLC